MEQGRAIDWLDSVLPYSLSENLLSFVPYGKVLDAKLQPHIELPT